MLALRRWPFGLLAILFVGVLVRAPGVLWGTEYPTGGRSHHVDEATHQRVVAYELNPAPFYESGRGPSYPKGLGTHVALPLIALRAVQGQLTAPAPSALAIILFGRAVVVFYGVATILLVFLYARLLIPRRPALPFLAAGVVALGGLHVTQSHFFLADVPTLFWTLLALYLLVRSLASDDASRHALHGAAFAVGVAFGLKLAVVAVPSLAIVSLRGKGIIMRLAYVATFFVAGLCIVSANDFSLVDLYATVHYGSLAGFGYEVPRLASAALYVLELPSIVSFPILILGFSGALLLCRRLMTADASTRLRASVGVLIPAVVTVGLVAFTTDNFPRHLLPLVPWMAIAAAYAVDTLIAAITARGFARATVSWWIVLPLAAYLAAFVFDGERAFWRDPRNDAERWVLANVPAGSRITWLGQDASVAPGYEIATFPSENPPDVIVCEMHFANYFLSGMGWRDSYPRNFRQVFAQWSQPSLDAWQSLFKGTSNYVERARFTVPYFMPEFTLTDRYLGDRSRNYVADIVIFRLSHR